MRLILALLLILPHTALSGPWGREPGEVFLSLGTNFALTDDTRRPVYYDPTLYAEWGLRPGTTLGLSAYSADGGEEVSGYAFWQQQITAPDARIAAAFSLGLGYRERELRGEERFLRAGLSAGMGTDWGWLVLDTALIRGESTGRIESKVDGTVGYNLSETFSLMGQLQTGIGTEGTAYTKFAPSLLYRLNDSLRLELGGIQSLTGDYGRGLRASLWYEF